MTNSIKAMSASDTVPGKVWLVGAGPGDAELLTLKAYRILQGADVWLVDDLISDDILALAPTHARIVPVGKRGGCPSTAQSFILHLMARYARAGLQVARVKGGDPFIFGRGGEELAWLHEQGIAAEAVGGLTAGLAAASQLNLPLTHRSVARGVAFVTAHTADGTVPDWQALAQSGLTLVCYMGMSKKEQLQRDLLQAGFAADLPVAVVERVSCRNERTIYTTLDTMSADICAAGLSSPALLIIGRAVAHRVSARYQPDDDVQSMADTVIAQAACL
ncbi:uroporphyrinogen-III C-methyltransferase [Advenella mimigardefordensis]|uniref:uroporphyrinogen-III C-methyltransferase n=1 Tax=Advenella mimigardefordensis (strain DSM 17166 / LMG 22922 / DPN7) TaxID=1247726 RepID=W0PCA5_ADVMD|nr:uroporphyrinogen-III C-methyltransferase [Advenella mimigardefordensis]AHG63045.1 uroporphyrinogen-III C-methyltransferase [Advenella mimigardefordensis DPN7]